MTVSFPDVSSYQDGLIIQPGTVALIAKATEGDYYQDACFEGFKSQAAAVGAIFSPYHFLKAGNGAAQADYHHAMVGSVRTMVDVEKTKDSLPSVWDCEQFVIRFHELGGEVWGMYFPRWYLDEVGGDFGRLRELGVALISSDYSSGYSDSGAGWDAYGGAAPMTPEVWQYTNQQPYGGKLVDFNAFRGTIPELRTLIMGETMTPQDVWAYKGNNGDAGFGPDTPDVHQSLLSTRDAVSRLQASDAQHTADLQGISALLVRIADKVGA